MAAAGCGGWARPLPGLRGTMIRYALRCADGHAFDGWFRNSAAYEAQAELLQIACAVCGSRAVEKAVMAPAVPGRRETAPSLSPTTAREKALAGLRRRIEESSDYVGRDFAAEARRIHLGETEPRSVWGEASREEASSLRDDGVPILPVPFMRRRDD